MSNQMKFSKLFNILDNSEYGIDKNLKYQIIKGIETLWFCEQSKMNLAEKQLENFFIFMENSGYNFADSFKQLLTKAFIKVGFFRLIEHQVNCDLIEHQANCDLIEHQVNHNLIENHQNLIEHQVNHNLYSNHQNLIEHQVNHNLIDNHQNWIEHQRKVNAKNRLREAYIEKMIADEEFELALKKKQEKYKNFLLACISTYN